MFTACARHTDYLKSEGTLEHGRAMAAHSSPRTTKLYDWAGEEAALGELRTVNMKR